MRLIDADKLKEEVVGGKIIIDEYIFECDSVHEILVYLLEKVEACVMEKIDAQPTVDVLDKIVEKLEITTNLVDDLAWNLAIGVAIEIVKEVGGLNERD